MKLRNFQLGDLVLRRSDASRPLLELNKLSPKWERPYVIREVIEIVAYIIAHLDGRPIQNTWNTLHLKKYYQ